MTPLQSTITCDHLASHKAPCLHWAASIALRCLLRAPFDRHILRRSSSSKIPFQALHRLLKVKTCDKSDHVSKDSRNALGGVTKFPGIGSVTNTHLPGPRAARRTAVASFTLQTAFLKMAPKAAEKQPAKKSVSKVGGAKPKGRKKGGSRKAIESYKIYIYKVHVIASLMHCE